MLPDCGSKHPRNVPFILYHAMMHFNFLLVLSHLFPFLKVREEAMKECWLLMIKMPFPFWLLADWIKQKVELPQVPSLCLHCFISALPVFHSSWSAVSGNSHTIISSLCWSNHPERETQIPSLHLSHQGRSVELLNWTWMQCFIYKDNCFLVCMCPNIGPHWRKTSTYVFICILLILTLI